MVCSGTVVKDPKNPGRSNLLWTAGHWFHAGSTGGWYRNIVFVPAYNDQGKSAAALENAQPQEIAPYGAYWADWAASSGEWIADGGGNHGEGAPYDYAYCCCTMTGGFSGGGWFSEGADGKLALVSNTSIGLVTSGWLAGPRLGEGAQGVFTMMSEQFAGQ